MKPHKHADLIKLWADGAQVQTRDGIWYDIDRPTWGVDYEYRIKPDIETNLIPNAAPCERDCEKEEEMNKKDVQPVAWMLKYKMNGDLEVEFNMADEFSCGRSGGLPLYEHPPAADVQELVEALRRLEEVASDCDIGYMDNAVRHARVVLDKWEGK